MSDYYTELAASPDPAGRDGWRHPLEQWLRFELVRRGLGISDDDHIVDLGCGSGELCAYLGGPRRSGRYLGIDRRQDAVNLAKERHPSGAFLCADMDEDLIKKTRHEKAPFDFAVAIGTMVDGVTQGSEQARHRALSRLVERLSQLGRRGWALVVLNQEVLRENAIRSLDGYLRGASKGEILTLARGLGEEVLVTGRALPTDLLVVSRRGQRASQILERVDGDAAHLAVLQRWQVASGVDEADEAWFWLISGRIARAEQALKQVSHCDPRRSILSAQINAARVDRLAGKEAL